MKTLSFGAQQNRQKTRENRNKTVTKNGFTPEFEAQVLENLKNSPSEKICKTEKQHAAFFASIKK